MTDEPMPPFNVNVNCSRQIDGHACFEKSVRFSFTMYRIRNVKHLPYNLNTFFNQHLRDYSLKTGNYRIIANDTEQSISIDVGDE